MDKNIIWHPAAVTEERRTETAGQKGMVLWLTGLSGSGKSTIAAETEKRLLEMGFWACILDGDNLRHGINANLGFTESDREENIRRVSETASLMASAGLVVLVSVISPYASMRLRARHTVEKAGKFLEVYVKADIDTCKKRDPKGLYQRALKGEIQSFTGISAPYEVPEMPDLVIDTDKEDVLSGARKLVFAVAETQEAFFLRKVIEHAAPAAIEAGEAVLDIYSQDVTIEYKEDRSPLTLADRMSSIVISEMLYQKFGLFPLLSEEIADNRERLLHEYCFIVDPLDGTKEFINKNGEFTINIGLSYRGEAVAGVVYAPASKKLYYAAKGLGAFALSPEKYTVALFDKSRRICVSERTEKLVVMCSRSHPDKEEELLLERNRPRIGKIIRAGSSLKGCLIAAGEADIYYRRGPTMEWDTCAMQAVVQEAGGIMRQGDGTALVYNRENSKNEKGFYILNKPGNELN